VSRTGAAVTTLDNRDNAITPMRLFLAVLVIVSHSFVVGGFGLDPLYAATSGQLQLGSAAVVGFFGLSGYLLARSRERSSIGAYARNRALRIVPCLWVCVAVTVFIVIPVAVAMGGTADPAQVRQFAIAAATFQFGAVAVDGLYAGNALPNWVNGPLWTLPPEVVCYLVLALIPRRALGGGVVVVLALTVLANAATGGLALYLHLPVAFFTGASLYSVGSRVAHSHRAAAAATLVTIGAWAAGVLAIAAPVTLPLLALWAGMHAKLRFGRDLSYGVYVYGWPIQQLLAMAGAAALGALPFFAIALVPILLVALISWTFVEEPALRLRARGQRIVASPASMT
jgi:peptidoglycan/LPS O-acetylase OafA/YrhL